MHKNRSFTVIAINPGWRYLGIAIFDCAGLKEWRLKNMPGKDKKAKLDKVSSIVSHFIERYAPTMLAIKELHPSRSSPNLRMMASRIEAACRKHRMRVCSYSVKELESVISPGYRINKKDLSELLASEYPALFRELEREKRNRNPYHLRLFEAVALGHICFQNFLISNQRQADEEN
ncbi:MAG: hypothetical protein WC798_01330 [Candidatus Paceibacterota bacterium]|jgi:hypothetical protein